MDSRFEARIEELGRLVEDLARRVDRIEDLLEEDRRSEPPVAVVSRDTAEGGDYPVPRESVEGARMVAHIGRMLVILAGAFFFRAITDMGVIPLGLGATIGLVYAFLWIFLADRSAAGGRRARGGFYLIGATLIAFPLIAEITHKHALIGASVGAVGVGITTLAFLAVCWRRWLRGPAWVVIGAAVVSALGLGALTGQMLPFMVALLMLAVTTLALKYSRGWEPMSWVVSAVLNLAVILTTLAVILVPQSRFGTSTSPNAIVLLQMALVLAVVGIFAFRSLVLKNGITAFEVVQTVGVMVSGLVGSVALIGFAGASTIPVVVVSLALAVGAYVVSFTLIGDRLGLRENFLFYTTLALTLTVIAAGLLLDATSFTLASAVLSVASMWLGTRASRVTLHIHGAVYALAAAVSAGLIATSLRSFVGSPQISDWSTVPILVVLGTAAVGAWITVATIRRTWGKLSRAPKLVLLAILTCALDGFLVAVIASVLADRWATDPGLAAVVRTAVLASTAVLLAWTGRTRRLFEARWLVYPVLVVGALQLVLGDFAHGRPTTLFLSLAMLGGALIFAPRMIRNAS